MSGVHFALETDQQSCYVSDLGSSNGTFVNGRRIAARTRLQPGDKITAGQTQFVLRGEFEAPPQAGSVAAPTRLETAPAPPEFAAPEFPSEDRPKVHYTVERTESGLTLCRGSVAEIPPAQLATLFCQACPAYLLVDFKNLGIPRPEELESPAYLFDWLEPPAAARASPVLISQLDLLGWPSLIEQGWGANGVICLFSGQDKDALLQQLRRSLRVKPERRDMGGGMLGFCWPSVMSMLLAHAPAPVVRQLLAGIDAVLVEFADLPETWQLFGHNRVADQLARLGFSKKTGESGDSQAGQAQ